MKRLLLVTFLLSAALMYAQDLTKPLYSALPTYPERARDARITGVVKLWFVLDESGAVKQAGILSGHPMLAQAALQVVKTWKFSTEGLKANTRYETEFAYELGEQQKKGAPRLTVTLTDFRRVEVSSEHYVEPIE